MRRVDHLDAGVDRSADERDVGVRVAEPIRAEPYSTDFRIGEAKLPARLAFVRGFHRVISVSASNRADATGSVMWEL